MRCRRCWRGSARTETTIVENPDGSVAIAIDGQETVLPAGLAAATVDAVRNNAGDIESLRAPIRILIAGHAGGAGDAALATAIAAFAVASPNGRSGAVIAIAEGAAAGNPSLAIVTVLAALPPAPDAVAGHSGKPPSDQSGELNAGFTG